jgi:hypothetical protein
MHLGRADVVTDFGAAKLRDCRLATRLQGLAETPVGGGKRHGSFYDSSCSVPVDSNLTAADAQRRCRAGIARTKTR